MAIHTIEMPKLSDTMTKGRILKWLVKEGELVEIGDVIAEVETDRAVIAVECFDEGILSRISVSTNEWVPVGEAICYLSGGAELALTEEEYAQVEEPTASLKAEISERAELRPVYLKRGGPQRDRLGTAMWADPVGFAERHIFEEGDFWIGRSPITHEPIGFSDDRHVLMASGTRSGKGTSIIINNLCSWLGSIVVLDPKGENASVSAARRGPGSEYCEGLGQSVHVLDPFEEATVDESLRSRYNPLDSINMDGARFNDEVMRIVSSIIVKPEGSRDKFFDLSSQDLLRGLILHVRSSPDFEGQRTLASVRKMLSHGEQETVELLKSNGVEGNICPFDMLWESMVRNEAGNGIISGIGKRVQSVKIQAPETYQGIFQNCLTETMFLDSPAIQSVTEESDFQLSELKTNPKGLSLYLCLSLDDMESYFKWLRIMITLTTSAMIKTKGRPATGYQTLMCLDEFASLQRMKLIEDAVAQLAGYGLKMFFIVQDFGQLKNIYKDNWETFIGNAGLKLLFGQNDHQFTLKYISEVLGETEVSRLTRTGSHAEARNRSESEGENESASVAAQKGTSRGHTETKTLGENKSRTNTKSKSQTKGRSATEQWSRNWNRSKSWGRGESKQRGGGTGSSWNSGNSDTQNFETGDWGLGQALQGWSPLRNDQSTSQSSQSSRSGSDQKNWSRGTTENEGGSRSSGGGYSKSKGTTFSETDGESRAETIGESRSFSEAESLQESESETRTKTEGTSRQITTGDSQTDSEGFNETLQARPLLAVNEMKKWFSAVSDKSSGHYPGYCLVMIADEDPTVVRRANYYEDSFYIGWHDPHPDWPESAPPKYKAIVEIPGLPGWDVECLKWLAENEEDVEKGASLVKVGPFPYDSSSPHIEDAFEHVSLENIEIDRVNSEFYWTISAPNSGRLEEQVFDVEAPLFGRISTNQRMLFLDDETPEISGPRLSFNEFMESIEDYVQARKQQEVDDEIRALEQEEFLRREAKEREERLRIEQDEMAQLEKQRLEEESRRKKAMKEKAELRVKKMKIASGIAVIVCLMIGFLVIAIKGDAKLKEEEKAKQMVIDEERERQKELDALVIREYLKNRDLRQERMKWSPTFGQPIVD